MISKHISASKQTFFQIENKACTATIYLQGAHLTHWQPKHTALPVIWLSDNAIFEQGTAIRGGIPLCWPWFGDKEGDTTHGFARNFDWELIDATSNEDIDELKFVLKSSETTKTLCPFDFELTAVYKLGKELAIELTTENTGESSFEITQAIHTYFYVQDVLKTYIDGLDGRQYIDKTDHLAMKTHHGRFDFKKEQNAIFSSQGVLELIDESVGRKIVVDKSADSYETVVWNPWIERSKNMIDMPDDGYKTMVCIEAGNIGKGAVNILPNQKVKLAQYIAVNH